MKTQIFKSIKNHFILVFFSLSLFTNSYAQIDLHLANWDSTTNFFEVKDQMNSYLDSLRNTMDSATYYSGGGEYKEWKFFERLWEPRATHQGGITEYFDAEYDYYYSTKDSYGYHTIEAWHELGPKMDMPNDQYKGIGPVEFITFYDNGTNDSTNYMLTGSTMGGLFYSTDAGETWNKTGTDNWDQSGCISAVFHPNNHRVWYAASSGNGSSTKSGFVGRTGGVFKSVDEGQNWMNIADHEDLDGVWTEVYKILIDPVSTTTLFAVTSNGLFKTTACEDSNPGWTEVEDGFFYDLEYKPDNNSILYSSAYINGSWEILRSQNYGDDWSSLPAPEILTNGSTNSQFFTIEVSKAKPGYIYCIARDGTNYSFYYCNLNVGTNWVFINSHTDYHGFGAGHSFGVEQVVNGEEFIVSYGLRLYKYTIPTGSSYLTGIVHVDVEDVIYHPYNINEVWACTHGGAEKSTDGGNTWIDKYNGLGVAQVEQMATSYSNPEYVMTGQNHDGSQLTRTPYSVNWNPQWEHVYGGDGMKPVIDNKDPNNMWASGQEGVWAYSKDKFDIHSNTFSGYQTAFFQNVGVINKQNSAMFFWNKFNDPNKEEVYRSDEYGPDGNVGFISDFSSIFSSSHEVYILGLVTPYSNGDHLIAFLRDIHKDASNKDEMNWHLFRTTNANAASVSWEELEIPTDEFEITSVEFHPENPDIIYLSYVKPINGFYAPPPYNMVYRIDYSVTPVEIVDITGNLPYTIAGANCLAAVNDYNESLYLATEFGVFYTNDDLQAQTGNEWKLVGTELPHCRNSGIEINYFCNSIRVGTYGRGTWELPMPCDLVTQALEISTNTTWNYDMRIDRIVNVNPGATLTINEDARVGFIDDAKLIVHPGAKLVIDGGTLTNACDEAWQGIEVWGNPNATQIPANQGWLVITNGGTIENAEVAVRVGSEDYTGKGGGIVQANAEFLNNDIGVYFDPYSYTTDNTSIFLNCNFDITKTVSGEFTFTHAKLNDVHGISFSACSFANNSNYNHIGYGIYSSNSIFNITGISSTKSQFENLDYGIYATAANTTDLADIRNTTFTENHHGIYLSGMTLPRVTSNEFYLKKAASQDCYGLYLDACTGYWVEDNTFEKCDGCGHETGIGIYVNESGKDPNEIYLNSFNDVEYAVIAKGNNRHKRDNEIGLVIRCNDYNNTLWDETVIYDGIADPPPSDEGIALHQGSDSPYAEDMAGNLFHIPGPSNDDYDDLNNESNDFIYYYPYNVDQLYENVEPKDFTDLTITAEPVTFLPDWTYDDGCPSGLESSGGGSGTEGLRSTMSDADAGIASTEATLAILVDGGDTETLNAEVQTSVPPETIQVYNELMDNSPYLSDTVVGTAIEKEDVLPNAMVRDIMVANPQSARSNQLMEQLDDRLEPLPEYMKAQILQGKSVISIKEELESRLAAYKLKKAKACNSLVRYFLSDTLNPAAISDSLTQLFQNDNSLASKYKLAMLHLNRGELQTGMDVLNALPTQFDLLGNELAEHLDFVDIYSLLTDLSNDGKTIFEADSLQLSQLHTVEASQQGIAAVYARNILLALNQIEYEEPVVLPNLLKSSEATAEYRKLMSTEPPKQIEIYPNPSDDYVIIAYMLEMDEPGCTIGISDLNGMHIQTIDITSMQDQVVVDTQNWKPGVYIATLKKNGKPVESFKFTIL